MSFWPATFLTHGLSRVLKTLLGLLAVLAGGPFALGAQEFVNLDFEQGTMPVGYQYDNTNPVERLEILPGWTTFYVGEGFETDLNKPWAAPLLMWGDSVCIGSPCVWIRRIGASHGRRYLDIDTGGSAEMEVQCGIRQTALVPSISKSLLFEATVFGNFGPYIEPPVELTMEEAKLTAVPIGQTNGWTTYAVNVGQFAGAVVTLAVAARAQGGLDTYLALDNVRFVPEQLLPVASPALSWRRDRQYLQINYTGILQRATSADSDFLDVPGAFSPYWADVSVGSGVLFRTRN